MITAIHTIPFTAAVEAVGRTRARLSNGPGSGMATALAWRCER